MTSLDAKTNSKYINIIIMILTERPIGQSETKLRL